MSYFNVFRINLKKNSFIFDISTVEFVKYQFLTNTVNFGIRFAVTKGPESAFSEDPGPGWDPLPKMCLNP